MKLRNPFVTGNILQRNADNIHLAASLVTLGGAIMSAWYYITTASKTFGPSMRAAKAAAEEVVDAAH